MTKTFNKTLLAAALVAAAGSANAATLASASVVGLSNQASTTALTINGPALTLTSAVAYAANYEVVLTFSGGEMTVAPAAPAGWTRIAQTATTATYRASGAVASGTAVVFSGYQFTSASALTAGTITVSALVKSDTGVVIDPAGTGQTLTAYVLRTGDQFKANVNGSATNAAVTKTVDLGKVRKLFTGSGAATYTYSVDVTSQNLTAVPAAGTVPAATFTSSATAGAVKHTVYGDFAWIQDSDAATDGIQAKTGTLTASAGCNVNSVMSTAVVFTCTNAGANSLTFDVRQGGKESPVALNDGNYAVTVEHAYGTKGETFASLTEVVATKFNNNGTSHNVFYMPYGSGISQILYVTNTTSQEGAIRVTAWGEDGTKVLDGVSVGTTTPMGQTSVAQAVRSELSAAGVTQGKVRLAFDVETSGSQMFAAYNVRGDRLATK